MRGGGQTLPYRGASRGIPASCHSLNELKCTVGEGSPAVVRGQVVNQTALKLLPLEDGLSVGGELV